MHVDWNWIKQRPHFIAEKLYNNGIDIDIYYHKYFNKNSLVTNDNNILNIHKLPRIPFSRFLFIEYLNKKFYEKFILKLLKTNKYDYVYITHPTLFFDSIQIPIIYDCMDDALAFSNNAKKNKILFDLEFKLIKKAHLILFTAENLKKTVLERYKFADDSKYIINNNAIELPKFNIAEIYPLGTSNKIKLVYIGTVTEWFDFDLLKKLDSSKYEFHLFGPSSKLSSDLPENFILHGAVSREKIFSIMNSSDILIMPFKVTDLIKSVNPVKLYEYIYSCKPIISVKYGETEKFSDFVYLYENNNINDFTSCIEVIRNNNFKSKQSSEKCKEFVEKNTWEKRVKDILVYLNK